MSLISEVDPNGTEVELLSVGSLRETNCGGNNQASPEGGVKFDGVVCSAEKGVPQGGVVSPLLANVVLNRLDWFLHDQGHYGNARDNAHRHRLPKARFVRSADDWCVFITRGSKRYAERLRDRTRELFDRDCSVQLSDEKTRITHVRDGFDFLGFRMVLDTGQSGKSVPKIQVPRRAITRIIRRLNEAMRYRPLQESGAARIVRGSSVIRGWSNYFRIAHDYSRAANTLDHHAFWIATKSLCRKFDLSTAQCLRKYGTGARIGMSEGCVLKRAKDTKRDYYLRRPDPYQPGYGCYLEDLDWEVDFQVLDGRRPGSMDTKVLALFHNGYRCRKCGTTVTYEDSEADHIKPVNRFASFRQADIPTNVQILCQDCHRAKTAEDR